MKWAEAEKRYSWLLRAVSDTPVERLREHKTIFRRALAIGSQSFILETYARFPEVFNARKRPTEPFVTDIGTQNGTLFASHEPRDIAIG